MNTVIALAGSGRAEQGVLAGECLALGWVDGWKFNGVEAATHEMATIMDGDACQPIRWRAKGTVNLDTTVRAWDPQALAGKAMEQ